jgi:hypothetical protein
MTVVAREMSSSVLWLMNRLSWLLARQNRGSRSNFTSKRSCTGGKETRRKTNVCPMADARIVAAVIALLARGAAQEEREASDKCLSRAVSDARSLAAVMTSLARGAAREERKASDVKCLSGAVSDGRTVAAVMTSLARGAAHVERKASGGRCLFVAVSEARNLAAEVKSPARGAAQEERKASDDNSVADPDSDDNSVADPDSDAQKRGSGCEKGFSAQAWHDCGLQQLNRSDTSAS